MPILAPEQLKISDHEIQFESERRINFRADCSLEVTTQVNGECRDTVRLNDISKSGVSLVVSPGTIIPNEFAIEGLVEEGSIQCQVAWRYKRMVGVKFLFANRKPVALVT